MHSLHLIGVSGFAAHHYSSILDAVECGCARFASATVINPNEEPEKVAEMRALGCAIFSDYREMLSANAGQPGICFIPTGIHLHRPMTCAAVASGLDVLVEKPAAASVADVDTMCRAGQEAGKFIAVGFQHIYAPETMEVKRMLLANKLGAVRSIRVLGLWPRNDAYYARNGWAGKLRLGEHLVMDSPFNNAFSHMLNLIAFLAGDCERCSAKIGTVEAELYRAREIESPDTAAIRATTNREIELLFFASHAIQSSFGPLIEIHGDSGSMRWDLDSITWSNRSGESGEIEASNFETIRQNLMEAVLLRSENANTFICDLDIARTHTCIVEAAHASSAIHNAPTEAVRAVEDSNSNVQVWEGLDTCMHESFVSGKMFHEAGYTWARKGKVVDTSEV